MANGDGTTGVVTRKQLLDEIVTCAKGVCYWRALATMQMKGIDTCEAALVAEFVKLLMSRAPRYRIETEYKVLDTDTKRGRPHQCDIAVVDTQTKKVKAFIELKRTLQMTAECRKRAAADEYGAVPWYVIVFTNHVLRDCTRVNKDMHRVIIHGGVKLVAHEGVTPTARRLAKLVTSWVGCRPHGSFAYVFELTVK